MVTETAGLFNDNIHHVCTETVPLLCKGVKILSSVFNPVCKRAIQKRKVFL